MPKLTSLTIDNIPNIAITLTSPDGSRVILSKDFNPGAPAPVAAFSQALSDEAPSYFNVLSPTQATFSRSARQATWDPFVGADLDFERGVYVTLPTTEQVLDDPAPTQTMHDGLSRDSACSWKGDGDAEELMMTKSSGLPRTAIHGPKEETLTTQEGQMKLQDHDHRVRSCAGFLSRQMQRMCRDGCLGRGASKKHMALIEKTQSPGKAWWRELS